MPAKGQTKSNATADSKKQRAYNSKPQQKKNRAARNKARREAIKKGSVKKGDGKDVGHKKGLMEGGSNAKSNRRVENAKSNRKKGAVLGGKRKAAAGKPKTKGK